MYPPLTPYRWGKTVYPPLFFPDVEKEWITLFFPFSTVKIWKCTLNYTLFPLYLTWKCIFFTIIIRWRKRVYSLHSFSPLQREKKFKEWKIIPTPQITDADCLVELLCACAWAPPGSDDCCWLSTVTSGYFDTIRRKIFMSINFCEPSTEKKSQPGHDLWLCPLQSHTWNGNPARELSVHFNVKMIVRGYHAYQST